MQKNNWQKKKCITEPTLIAIRRRKIQAVRMEAEYAGASSKGNLMRKIHYLKEVIQLLKTIQGTEEERKALLQEIAQIEEASLSEMMVWSDKQDASGIVKELFRTTGRILIRKKHCVILLHFFRFRKEKG